MKYYSLNDYLRDKYGKKIYKIAIDAGFTCPNRDGTLGTGGCIFCSGAGSGDFAGDRHESITEQIEKGKKRIGNKVGRENGGYIAYFQAYTNTYAPVNVLEEKYMEAINHPEVVGLAIATRPDCISDAVVELIERINKIKPVWVELGLQTSCERTAIYIRRGYELPVFENAVDKLATIGVHIVTHVILGLPGEDKEKMLNTVRYVVDLAAKYDKSIPARFGIKLQLLHIIEGTDLAKDYYEGRFECLSMDEYIDIVTECLKLLPSDMVVHRLTGDGDKRTLIAPMWSTDKKRVLNELNRAIANV